jgi:hypothetical protein
MFAVWYRNPIDMQLSISSKGVKKAYKKIGEANASYAAAKRRRREFAAGLVVTSVTRVV